VFVVEIGVCPSEPARAQFPDQVIVFARCGIRRPYVMVCVPPAGRSADIPRSPSCRYRWIGPAGFSTVSTLAESRRPGTAVTVFVAAGYSGVVLLNDPPQPRELQPRRQIVDDHGPVVALTVLLVTVRLYVVWWSFYPAQQFPLGGLVSDLADLDRGHSCGGGGRGADDVERRRPGCPGR